MHNLLLGLDSSISSFMCDHRDGDGLNNTRANLRIATATQNSQNAAKRANASSQYKGVVLRRRRWEARISVNKVLIHLGMHATEEDAARVYDQAAMLHFGEFANLNFPRLTTQPESA